MDLNICKKCEKNCFIYRFDYKYNNFFIDIKQDNVYATIYFEEKNNKKIKQIFNKYLYYDDVKSQKYLLRNLTMKKNEFCPYYAEHLMSDLSHNEKMKLWYKKQKKIISLKKQLEKNKKGVILCQEDQPQKIIIM